MTNESSRVYCTRAPRLKCYLLDDILYGHDDCVLPGHGAVVLSTCAPLPDPFAAFFYDLRGWVYLSEKTSTDRLWDFRLRCVWGAYFLKREAHVPLMSGVGLKPRPPLLSQH